MSEDMKEVKAFPPISVDTNGAAALIGIHPKTLRNWRSDGEGPAYFYARGVGSRVLYRYDDLVNWVASRETVGSARA